MDRALRSGLADLTQGKTVLMSHSALAPASTQRIPADPALDSTLNLMREGYEFIANRCRALDADMFVTRLMGKSFVCMRGADAAALFYDERRFERGGAIPRRVVTSLFGKGGVQGLDGDEHAQRKGWFLSVLSPAGLAQLVDVTGAQWKLALSRWQQQDRVVLFDEVALLLTRAVCQWAGVPLAESEAAARAKDFLQMVDAFGGAGPRLWRGKLARHRCERWLARSIESVQQGRLVPDPTSALAQVAALRSPHGVRLSTGVAAVELINVLRPTVAITWYVAFAAHALLQQPHCLARLREDASAFDHNQYAHWFVQEVRRYYPFTPFVGAKVKESFEWSGYHFKRGQLVLLDVYGALHDAAVWEKPNHFEPERFNGWKGTAFDFIPQGGGPVLGHRCAGEWVTLQLLTLAVRFLSRGMSYEVVADQRLGFPLSRMPTKPLDGFVIHRARALG
jgi:fatty-acid peroxygenase